MTDNASAFAAQMSREEKGHASPPMPRMMVIPDDPIGIQGMVLIKAKFEAMLKSGAPIVFAEPVTVYQCLNGKWELLPRPITGEPLRWPAPPPTTEMFKDPSLSIPPPYDFEPTS